MNSPPTNIDTGALYCIANDIQAATADFWTNADLQPLSNFLRQTREALQMDVAFVSSFAANRRVFEVVSTSARSGSTLGPGASDDLIDTYCKLVASGRLPTIIPDTQASLDVAALPITQTLRIRSYLSAPIRLANGEVVGTVCCFSHAPRSDLRAEDAAALESIAQAIAVAIGRGGGLKNLVLP